MASASRADVEGHIYCSFFGVNALSLKEFSLLNSLWHQLDFSVFSGTASFQWSMILIGSRKIGNFFLSRCGEDDDVIVCMRYLIMMSRNHAVN